jgi:hypothetical protein
MECFEKSYDPYWRRMSLRPGNIPKLSVRWQHNYICSMNNTMPSCFQSIYRALCTGWVIEYPKDDNDKDFFQLNEQRRGAAKRKNSSSLPYEATQAQVATAH